MGWAEKCFGCDTIWIPWISIKVMTRNLELAEEVRVDRSRKTTFINECLRFVNGIVLRILKFGHYSNFDSCMACKSPKHAEEVCVFCLQKTTFINECVRISMKLLLRILKFGHCSILEQIHKSFFLLLLITLLLTLYVEKNSNFSLNVQSLCWHFENRLGIIFDEVCYQH